MPCQANLAVFDTKHSLRLKIAGGCIAGIVATFIGHGRPACAGRHSPTHSHERRTTLGVTYHQRRVIGKYAR
jgi:hypothetical protein